VLGLGELQRAARLLDARLRGARLDKIVQPDEHRVVLSFRGAAGETDRCPVLLCCDPQTGRLSALAERPRAPRTPPAFAQALRSRLGRARTAAIRCAGGDRQVRVELEGREGRHTLLLSLMGARSNLYLLDADDRVRDALRPLARTRRALAIGEPWRDPETAPPSPGPDRFAAVPDAELFAAIESTYAARERAAEAEERARRLEEALGKATSALRRKRAALGRDLEAAGDADRLRRRGELLKSALERVRKGMERIDVEDWETGESVEIPLDPTKTPAENLEAVFRRYRKRARAVEPLSRQIEDLDRQIAEQERWLEELHRLTAADPPDAEGLARLAERPGVARLLARYRPQAPPAPRRRASGGFRLGGRELPARLQPRRYRSSTGLEIWVGRSDEGNDLLSTRLARGKDLFFHLEGSPGSHVILRTEGRPDPPPDALLEAAELAVHFSRHRNASQADVHVVPVKNVSKPRGAKPGLVLVTGGRSLHLRRDAGRLARVLESRIEEGAEG